jgi:hypothetical protein
MFCLGADTSGEPVKDHAQSVVDKAVPHKHAGGDCGTPSHAAVILPLVPSASQDSIHRAIRFDVLSYFDNEGR